MNITRRWNRCCCGRIEDADDNDDLPLLINGTLHERLGPDGAFCGPWKDHALRDTRAALDDALSTLSAYGHDDQARRIRAKLSSEMKEQST